MISKQAKDDNLTPSFTGLIEIMSAEVTIVTAIHNIKANSGINTKGTDNKTMQKDYLNRPYKEIIEEIQQAFKHYEPNTIKRVWIPKPGKTEKRPLGIPTIKDRIIQECIRLVIEPIAEGQFFKHSYGFRPMRDTKMALARITNLIHDNGYKYIIEGDISKCFDNIDHNILLKRLYHIGIKDTRVIQIIKTMLKAGILNNNEIEIPKAGTPQGGILSPLLANIYLDKFDKWVSKQWEEKKTRYKYSSQHAMIQQLNKTKLQPAYLVRYADDWCLITNSKENAIKWKERINIYLKEKLKLDLSIEKTKITNVTKNYITFLGYEYKLVPGKWRTGFVTKTRPDRKRLKTKVKEIAKEIKDIPLEANKMKLIHRINKINSMIRGVINYYECTTYVYMDTVKYAYYLANISINKLRKNGGKLVSCKCTNNLTSVHQEYNCRVPAIRYKEMYIGITYLSMCKFRWTENKNQNETPYTAEGRKIYAQKNSKRPLKTRADDIFTLKLSEIASLNLTETIDNFEYVMNRGYVFNRDKGKCKICGNNLHSANIKIHRINRKLDIDKINKVNNLICTCRTCYSKINNNIDINNEPTKIKEKIIKYKEKVK